MFVLFETMLAADLTDDMLVKTVGCGKWQFFFENDKFFFKVDRGISYG